MTIAHVRYREGQILRAVDLRDEQRDRLEGWRRHILSVHGWGIARGLALTAGLDGLTVEPLCRHDSIALVVAPGLAFDRGGRALVLAHEQAFWFDQLAPVANRDPWCVGVWLWPTSATVDCSTRGPRGARQEACIVLAAPPAGTGRSPFPAPLDESWSDATPRSPVYLGTIHHKDGCCWIPRDAGEVPYVSLVGSVVRAPSGTIEMQLGRERLDDFTRFAVRTFHDRAAPETADQTREGTPPRTPVERIKISATGRITLRGPVEIVPTPPPGAGGAPPDTTGCQSTCPKSDTETSGTKSTDGTTEQGKEQDCKSAPERPTASLVVDNACATRPRALRFPRPLTPRESASPWHIMRTKEDENGQLIDRLRIELPDVGMQNDPFAPRLAIGYANPCDCCQESEGDQRGDASAQHGAATNASVSEPQVDATQQATSEENGATGVATCCCFQECLAMTADCSLEITGCLVACGRIVQMPIQADPNDPRFGEAQLMAIIQALLDAFLLTVPAKTTGTGPPVIL